jgi:chemotaxis protein histidine kinase CheA
LGLHIVDMNVKLLNGHISFTSELNVGTQFIVTLPGGEANHIAVDFTPDHNI